ncbi:response regulator [Sphingomonas sp. PB4P5]|uniref:response regulator n=1 Tax=Parasphingomonas puruogangriensis TaxID=3096155 RepID=UPI002FC59292
MKTSLLAGRRVLVVEDDYLLGIDLAATLQGAGAEVIGPASSVAEALDMLDPLPDVASLDVQLGDETSFPIADELARRGIPFVFVTGSANTIPTSHGTRPICHKPAPGHAVMSALADALTQSAGANSSI